jgi:hypothetical protein
VTERLTDEDLQAARLVELLGFAPPSFTAGTHMTFADAFLRGMQLWSERQEEVATALWRKRSAKLMPGRLTAAELAAAHRSWRELPTPQNDGDDDTPGQLPRRRSRKGRAR